MKYFAKVVDGLVVRVIVAEPEFFNTFVDDEPGEWIQTTYNTRAGVHYDNDGNPDGGEAMRKNYAGIGYTYDNDLDAFIEPQPYPSWILNEDICCYESPVEYPDDGPPGVLNKIFLWDEESLSWVELEHEATA